MLPVYQQLITNQYEAALCMLGACVVRCPDARWQEPVARYKFCQVVFHTLFFTDLYLGEDWQAIREQEFHRQHAAEFGEYEEILNREPQQTYEKPFITAYLQHCREKARRVVAAETEESLARRPAFPGKDFSRAELHVYNIRHVHHHAAQLTLRLRLDTDVDVPWIGSGWRE